MKIGCHLSSSKGFEAMGREALKLRANTFQFFTRNPRGSRAKAIDPADVRAFLAVAAQNNFTKIVAHAPYTLNACAAVEKTREFAALTLADDLARMELLPHNYYNIHPGSHVGQGVEAGCALIADLLNQLLQPGQTTCVLLETMAGKGTEIGGRFEELRRIIDLVEQRHTLGVCLDTCHVFDAGYDLVNNLDAVLDEFDRHLGLDRLKVIHLNDSLNPLGGRKDRHAKIGRGSLGLAAVERIINHPQLRALPFILETPNDLAGYAEEIRLLRSLYTDVPTRP